MTDEISVNPMNDSDSDEGQGAVAKAAAKIEKKKAKEDAKEAKKEARAERREEAMADAEEAAADKEDVDPVLMALLHSIRCLMILFAVLLGIASALIFCVLLIAMMGTAEVKATAASVIIKPEGAELLAPQDTDTAACREGRFLVPGEQNSCYEVGGKELDPTCIPDEPMDWQLVKETWVCVDYEYSDPASLEELDDVSIYCLATEASKEVKDETQFWDCELPCPTPGQMMEKDMTVVDPDPEASVEGFGDYGFAFNRNTCLQCMACTAGYNDCSEPSAQYYHIEAQPPTFTEKSNTDPVEPRENSTVVYDADTEKYGDKIAVRIDSIYYAGEHRSDDDAKIYYTYRPGASCPTKDENGDRLIAAMTEYDPAKPPVIDFATTLFAFVRVNRLEDSPCTSTVYTFDKCAQPDLYPGTSEVPIFGLPVDFVTGRPTSQDIYLGTTIRDSASDGYVGMHYMTETPSISMSTRTTGAHVWYRIDRSNAANIQAAIIADGSQPIGSIPDPAYNPVGSPEGLPIPTNMDYKNTDGTGFDNDYHGDPGTCRVQGKCYRAAAGSPGYDVDSQVMPGDGGASTLQAVNSQLCHGQDLGGTHTGFDGYWLQGALIESEDRPTSRNDCENGLWGECVTAGGEPVPTATTQSDCEAYENVWNPKLNYQLVYSDVQAVVTHVDVGTFDTIGECASACTLEPLCKYFIYGKSNVFGSKVGRCWREEIDDESVVDQATRADHFVDDAYDFYQVLGPVWTVPVQTQMPGPTVLYKTAVVTAVTVDPSGVLADSDETIVAYIVRVEPVTCDTPYDQGRYTADVLITMSTPTPDATIDYRLANTDTDQVYSPDDPPRKYEATGVVRTMARKDGLQNSPAVTCPYCMQYGTPFYFSQDYNGWESTTDTGDYPQTYPSDLGGATTGASEDPDDNEKATAIILKQRNEVNGYPDAQALWTPSTGDTYITQDFCCERALDNDDLPHDPELYTPYSTVGNVDGWNFGAGSMVQGDGLGRCQVDGADSDVDNYAGCIATDGGVWTDDCKWMKYFGGDCGMMGAETCGQPQPALAFSTSHKFCTKVRPTIEDNCLSGGNGPGTAASEIISKVYHVRANPVFFSPENHATALYSDRQCIFLDVTNPLHATTPAYPLKIYYKVAPPVQRNNLLSASPGSYARDTNYPLDGSAAFSTAVDDSMTEYNGCIPITESTSIAAFAVGDGYSPSLLSVATYWIQVDAPTISTTNDGDRLIGADDAPTPVFYSFVDIVLTAVQPTPTGAGSDANHPDTAPAISYAIAVQSADGQNGPTTNGFDCDVGCSADNRATMTAFATSITSLCAFASDSARGMADTCLIAGGGAIGDVDNFGFSGYRSSCVDKVTEFAVWLEGSFDDSPTSASQCLRFFDLNFPTVTQYVDTCAAANPAILADSADDALWRTGRGRDESCRWADYDPTVPPRIDASATIYWRAVIKDINGNDLLTPSAIQSKAYNIKVDEVDMAPCGVPDTPSQLYAGPQELSLSTLTTTYGDLTDVVPTTSSTSGDIVFHYAFDSTFYDTSSGGAKRDVNGAAMREILASFDCTRDTCSTNDGTTTCDPPADPCRGADPSKTVAGNPNNGVALAFEKGCIRSGNLDNCNPPDSNNPAGTDAGANDYMAEDIRTGADYQIFDPEDPVSIVKSGKLYVYATKEGSIPSDVTTCEYVLQTRAPRWFQSGQMCIDIGGAGSTKCEVPAFLGSGFVVLTPAEGDESPQTTIFFQAEPNREADPIAPAICSAIAPVDEYSCRVKGNTRANLATESDCIAELGGVWRGEPVYTCIDYIGADTGTAAPTTQTGCDSASGNFQAQEVSYGNDLAHARAGMCIARSKGRCDQINDDILSHTNFAASDDRSEYSDKCQAAGICSYTAATTAQSTDGVDEWRAMDRCDATDETGDNTCSAATSFDTCASAGTGDCMWTGASDDPVTGGRITSQIVCEGAPYGTCDDANGDAIGTADWTTMPLITQSQCTNAENEWNDADTTSPYYRAENPNTWFGTCSTDATVQTDRRVCLETPGTCSLSAPAPPQMTTDTRSDCLAAGGANTNTWVPTNTWTYEPPVGRWMGVMQFESVRVHKTDAENSNLGSEATGTWKSTKMLEAVVPVMDPSSKFNQWIQFTAKEYLYFSLKARVLTPFFVGSDELVQTFVIAKLLSLKATIVIEPSDAADANCNGCDPYNILVSSSGMFWNSRESTGTSSLDEVSISLFLPSEWKIDRDDTGKETGETCGMAFCVDNAGDTREEVCMRPGRCSDGALFAQDDCLDSAGTCTSTNGARVDEASRGSCATQNGANTWTPSNIWTASCVRNDGSIDTSVTDQDSCKLPDSGGAVTNVWTSSADWSVADNSGCTGTGAQWKPSVDQQDCGALPDSKWMPSTGCPLVDQGGGNWIQPQTPTDQCIPASENGFTTAGPVTCGCQSYQLLFWNIRYPFVPQENAPWLRDGSACTDYQMEAWGRVRTRCTDGTTGEPIVLTEVATCTGIVGTASEEEAAACLLVDTLDVDTDCVATANCEYTESTGGLIDDSMDADAEAACGTVGGQWGGDTPVNTVPTWYKPQFSAGASSTASGADAYRPDDLWTPVNPISVNTLRYTCSNPPVYMDYWSVFGIPRAPQEAYGSLGNDKCDDAQSAEGETRPNTPFCGPRQNADGEVEVRDVYSTVACVAGTETLDKYGRCSLTTRIGDGVCDANFNHPIFLYDELDCFYSAMQEISGSSIAFSG